MIIDLRSDTVTKPTPGMMEAMMNAQVGDDVFGEDPTIKQLEDKVAKTFGMDGGLFCPSGTMTNQIGINILTQPYDEVICYSGAHIYKYEGGGLMGNSGVSVQLLDGKNGVLSADEIEAAINPEAEYYAKTSLISLENTVNKGGGCYYNLNQIKAISEVSKKHDLKMHLDGARIFNAVVETGDSSYDYGNYFDTISVCFSKGLGAPVGSVLLFKNKYAKQAHRLRKIMGGGMRQAGYLAAAAIYAMDNHIPFLRKDHERAKALKDTLTTLPFVKEVMPVDTNILIFKLAGSITASSCLERLKENGILAVPFGPQEVRFVTHLDYTDEMLEKTITILKRIDLK